MGWRKRAWEAMSDIGEGRWRGREGRSPARRDSKGGLPGFALRAELSLDKALGPWLTNYAEDILRLCLCGSSWPPGRPKGMFFIKT